MTPDPFGRPFRMTGDTNGDHLEETASAVLARGTLWTFFVPSDGGRPFRRLLAAAVGWVGLRGRSLALMEVKWEPVGKESSWVNYP
jgi:hypothetical protein